jgi:CDP-6-deoxy-D-xylo-4-hexulose-3-dehydrase
MRYKLAESTWNNDEILAGISTLLSGRCTMGEKVKQFEKEFAWTFGSKYAVMSNSGSSANLLMATALKYRKTKYQFQDGDEVIVPALSWSTTYYPIHQNNLVLKFVDIDKETFNIDVSKIEEAIGPRTKAILAVNILGNPCNFKKLNEICDKHGLTLLEDNCESMYAKYDGKFCGTIGEMGTFSSFFSHHICTIEGGITLTDDEELYQYMLSLRAHGWVRELPQQNFVYNKSDDHTDNLFKFILPGYNLRPNEIYAAIGLEQIKKLPSFIATRNQNHNFFLNRLDSFNKRWSKGGEALIKTQRYEYGTRPSYFSLTLVLNDKFPGTKADLMKFLYEHEIECRPIVAGNFTKNPVIQHMKCAPFNNMSNADVIDQRGIMIGNHSIDLTDNIVYLFDVLQKYLLDGK